VTEFHIAMGVGRREPFQKVAELARAAEELGFAAIWLQDNPLTTKDPYVGLAVAAQATSRIALGPAVSNPLIRHHTVIVNSIASLDQLSEGRAVLGLGNGGPALLTALGRKPRKVADFREDIKTIRHLLGGRGMPSPDGSTYRVASVDRQVPVYVAARGVKVLKLSGEVADGVLVAGPAQPDILRKKIEIVHEGAREAGRDPMDTKINLLVNMAVDTDRQRAVDAVRPFAVGAIIEASQPGDEIPDKFMEVFRRIHKGHDSATHLAAGSAGPDLIPDELATYIAIAGDEKECRDRLQTIAAIGADQITLTLMSGGRTERLQLFAKVALS
jgi:5,10-methylenetetrahydromethanopterin reductase